MRPLYCVSFSLCLHLQTPANNGTSLHLSAPRRHGICDLLLRAHSAQAVTVRAATDG